MIVNCDRDGKKTLLLGRDVVKLITPGTLIEPLDNEANYLLCLSTGPGSTVGLAWIDISTGEFQVCMPYGIMLLNLSNGMTGHKISLHFFVMIRTYSSNLKDLTLMYAIICLYYLDIII